MWDPRIGVQAGCRQPAAGIDGKVDQLTVRDKGSAPEALREDAELPPKIGVATFSYSSVRATPVAAGVCNQRSGRPDQRNLVIIMWEWLALCSCCAFKARRFLFFFFFF